MIQALQQAHYVQGRRIAETAVLHEVATELGLAGEAFDAHFASHCGTETREHIEESRHQLDRVGGRGFPTFALEDARGSLSALDIGFWLGRPAEWAQEIAGRL